MASLFEGMEDPTLISFPDPNQNGKTVEFAIDVTKTINTQLSAQVTRFPVEQGFDITDHIQPDTKTMTLECFVSIAPSQRLLSIASSLAGRFLTTNIKGQGAPIFGALLRGGIATIANQGVSAKDYTNQNYMQLLGSRTPNDTEYPKKVMQGLVQIMELGTVFNIKTYMSKILYQDMVMTGLSFSQNVETGKSLNFTMTVRHIKTISSLQKSSLNLKSLAPGASTSVAKGQSTPQDSIPPSSIGTSSAWA